MRARSQGTESSREKIAEMSGDIGGRPIAGRCFAVRLPGGRMRYEIELQSGQEFGVADVPADGSPEQLLWRAMELFAATMCFRT